MPIDAAARARAAARLGSVLRGKYRLDRVLGIGGMAAVYEATHRNTKQFAVKILHPELSMREDLRTRFLREGYAANTVKHPGAVTVLDEDTSEDGAAFLVMELLEGLGVDEIGRRLEGPWPVEAVLAVAHQLLDVLAAAHAKNVVHRDIKPENLFVQSDGTLKVLDFGIARVRDAVAGEGGTATGLMLGTPAFMAPEQALGRSQEVDARTDLWSVGATLFVLLSGRFVHEGANPSELMVAAATQPAPPLARVAPVPAPVGRVVDKALAFDKADRWESAAAMRAAVDRALEELTGGPASRAPLVRLLAQVKSVRLGSERTIQSAALLSTAASDPDLLQRSVEPPTPAPSGGTTASPHAAPPIAPARRSLLARFALPGLVFAAGIAAAVGWRTSMGHRDMVSTLSSSPARCTGNAACTVAAGRPAVCRKTDGVCVAVESEDCKALVEPDDAASDDTLWIGAMLPLTGPRAAVFGTVSANTLDVARRDFAGVGGLPPRPGHAGRRGVAVALCDLTKDATRAARHLVDEVGVPAVIGFGANDVAIDVSSHVLLPAGVLVVATLDASPLLTTIPRPPGAPRLVWRTTAEYGQEAAAFGAVATDFYEASLARDHVVDADHPTRVAVVRPKAASAGALADALYASLRFNGKSVLDNGESFHEFLIPPAGGPEPLDVAGLVSALARMRPHVVFVGNDVLSHIAAPLEASWPSTEKFRPHFVSFPSGDAADKTAVCDFFRPSAERRKRWASVEMPLLTPVNARLVVRYNELFQPPIDIEDAPGPVYDAVYLVAYAAYAAGDEPLTGAALARQIPRLLPPGPRVDVGPRGIFDALGPLARGDHIDLNGAGTPLDLDPVTGESPSGWDVLCIRSHANDPNGCLAFSGMRYDAASKTVSGRFECP